MATFDMMPGLRRRLCQRLFILLSFSSLMIMSESDCINSSRCRQKNYVKHNIHVNEGCGECEVKESTSRLSCAQLCSTRDNCSAFTYQDDGARCMMCERQMVRGLADKGESSYFLPKDLLQELTTVDMIEASVWPKGTYGLPQPLGGCPDNETQSPWRMGTMNLNTESDFASTNEASEPITLAQPVFSVISSRNYANFHFCMKSSNTTLGPPCEAGSYCIYKKGDCPPGFNDGNIFFDAEDDLDLNIYTGVLPDGMFTHNAKLSFCCRKDSPACVEIILPKHRPFYLFHFGGTCQRVKDMIVHGEYMVVDTENNDNADSYNNEFHPCRRQAGQCPHRTVLL